MAARPLVAKAAPTGVRLSLRAKGVLMLAALFVYFAAVAGYVAHQRRNLLVTIQEMEAIQANADHLRRVEEAIGHSIEDTLALSTIPETSPTRRAAALELSGTAMRPVQVGLPAARRAYAPIDRDALALERALAAMAAAPSTPHVMAVRDRQQELAGRVSELVATMRSRSDALGKSYHASQQAIGFIGLSANTIGVVAAIVTILLFFTRLTRDIARLQDRASAIVTGYSGEPLRNTRRDEVGGLIDAVNRMQVDLRRYERQQEVTRQQRFHQEKMAAVGSLATAIGHEVSNPIAAITGVAQFMVDETREPDGAKGQMLHDFAAEILKQTQRITVILRQLATLTTPPSPKAELLDLNALIRSTCSFISYDARFRGIEFEFDLDPAIPAVSAVTDHITQILMNLLINAADAMEGEGRRIRISTHQAEGEVQVSITDNGHGMSPEVLAKAFTESFTTKPVGKGRGIGLFLCKTLIEEGGGRIALESAPGVGTTAALYLPS
jgi:two-component system NtrC family sensor kinase